MAVIGYKIKNVETGLFLSRTSDLYENHDGTIYSDEVTLSYAFARLKTKCIQHSYMLVPIIESEELLSFEDIL